MSTLPPVDVWLVELGTIIKGTLFDMLELYVICIEQSTFSVNAKRCMLMIILNHCKVLNNHTRDIMIFRRLSYVRSLQTDSIPQVDNKIESIFYNATPHPSLLYTNYCENCRDTGL